MGFILDFQGQSLVEEMHTQSREEAERKIGYNLLL